MTDEIKVGDAYWFIQYGGWDSMIYRARKGHVHKVYKNGNVVFEKGGQQYTCWSGGELISTGSHRYNGPSIKPDTAETRAEIEDGLMKTRAKKVRDWISEYITDGRNKIEPDRLARIVAALN